MLIESGKNKHKVSAKDIQDAAFRGTIFTEDEKVVSAKIVNFLRPFVQQRTKENKLPEPHILTRAPLAALANHIAVITGFPSLVRNLWITSQPTPRSLHLTAAGVYQAFSEQWDIPAGNEKWITSSTQAGKDKVALSGHFSTQSG